MLWLLLTTPLAALNIAEFFLNDENSVFLTSHGSVQIVTPDSGNSDLVEKLHVAFNFINSILGLANTVVVLAIIEKLRDPLLSTIKWIRRLIL